MNLINPAACRSYISSIIDQFDELIKPVPAPPSQDGTQQTSEAKKAPNIREWVYDTGILRGPLPEDMGGECAARLLRDLGKYGFDPSGATAKTKLFSYIFQRVFSAANIAKKRDIIGQLDPFGPLSNSFTFKRHRFVYKIEESVEHFCRAGDKKFYKRIFDSYSSSLDFPVSKLGLYCLAIIGSFLTYRIVEPRISRYVVHIIVPLAHRLLNHYAPAALQASTVAYQHVAANIAHFAQRRLGKITFYRLGGVFITPFLIGAFIPPLRVFTQIIWFIERPVFSIFSWGVGLVGGALFDPAAEVRIEIGKSLRTVENREEAGQLVEEGMKAYQVWMHLMENGAQQGLFRMSSSG